MSGFMAAHHPDCRTPMKDPRTCDACTDARKKETDND